MPPDDRWSDDPENPWRGGPQEGFGREERDRLEERFGPESGGTAAPQPGMGTGTKVLFGCLVLLGGLFLVCCGGVFYLATQFRLEVSPQDAVRITREIADVEIAEPFQPAEAVEANLLLFRMKGAIYRLEEADGVLILMEINLPPGETPDNLGRDLQRGLEQQGRGQELSVRRSERREFEIAGQAVPFFFSEAVDDRGRDFRQVSGTFQGRGGTAVLLLQVEEEAWDEEAVVRMIESIRVEEDVPPAP